MNPNKYKKPDYLFEVSWEVCNKVGGIHTVISTKAALLEKTFGNNYLLIGPDVWKETHEHPEFQEDESLYSAWKNASVQNGMNFRVGRWKIPGRPIAILVDFTPYFSEKDKVFTDLWEKYKVDSITGQWDYIEPALFGYAAARVIESFYEFYLSDQESIVAQFHEWMTAAGTLYLEDKVPQIGTIFTTHATTLGRSASGNGLSLYSDMEKFEPEQLARNINVLAKHSLEAAAARQSDCFTTVSQTTAKECVSFLGREPDVITVNGFDDSFVPVKSKFAKKRAEAREQLFEVAEGLINDKLSRKSLLVITSGRYEVRNKGLDLFIEALGDINRKPGKGSDVVAYITIPAHQTGPNLELLERMNQPGIKKPLSGNYTTHNLFDPEHDAILNMLQHQGLLNRKEDKVKVIFVPAYLDGNDGIFNAYYYDLLIGFDLSVFPSYYEPWGYTPLESAAFSIPTVTTTLAGFGLWVKEKSAEQNAVLVINRDDTNNKEVVDSMADFIREANSKNTEAKNQDRLAAFNVSRSALWENLIGNYYEAFDIALKKSSERHDQYYGKKQSEAYYLKDISKEHKPVWKKVFVQPALSGKLVKLMEIARNLWWTWNYDAKELFQSIDPEKWEDFTHNPFTLIESLSAAQLKNLEKDSAFIEKLDDVHARFTAYMAEASSKPDDKVAYFSMEYGLHGTLKIYSGGLGILAGDYLKEASDSNLNMVAVGLLYRNGYFAQEITIHGDQVAVYNAQRFSHLPILPVRDEAGNWVKISIALPGRVVLAKVWKADVGRIPLYLMDTDISENQPADQSITHQLYGGSWENRFKQELLLGVGGIRMLKALGIKSDIYHLNEGHAAFAGLERLRFLIQDKQLTFIEAQEVVRSSTLFTTHTPVPAGHDAFDENMLRTYIPHYADRLNIAWDSFINLGRMSENNPHEKFSMSLLAIRLSQEVNGVSKIHGRVSREMFKGLFEGYYAEELYIDHVTNGVHYPTWAGKKWQQLFEKYFGSEYLSDQSNTGHWEKIKQAPDKEVWGVKEFYRKELIDYLKKRLTKDLTGRQENPKYIFRLIENLNENALTIGFARRFATYKRAHLLFNNLDRLSQIVNDPDRPVQFIFAGKAHPADKAGQDLIKRIIEISKMDEFIGKLVFVENYDMILAKRLLQGVDVWLNTPTRPLEASGTSGEKALMNGVLNFSVLDGWWAEGYIPGGGWAIKEARTYTNQEYQNELDAETIYALLEDEIVPLFYDRKASTPGGWVKAMKKSVSSIAPHYTMKRMIDDYQRKFYSKLFKTSERCRANDFEFAREISAWKSKVISQWDKIEVDRLAVPDSAVKPLKLGDQFIAEIDLKLNGLKSSEVGVEILFGNRVNHKVDDILVKQELDLVGEENGIATYSCKIPFESVGSFDYAFRMFPKHEGLPHKQDLKLVRWI